MVITKDYVRRGFALMYVLICDWMPRLFKEWLAPLRRPLSIQQHKIVELIVCSNLALGLGPHNSVEIALCECLLVE